MNYIIYKIVRNLGKPLFRFLYRPQYIGINNIPTEGPVVLAGNHTNNLDAAIMITCSKRIVHMLAKKELFNSKIGAWFFKSMGCISVDRSKHDEKAKNSAIKVLKNNKVIGLFPEGTVNKTEKLLLPFKYGAVSFAKKTTCPIVPFSITGEYKLFKKSIKIIFGTPYMINSDLDTENKILYNKVEKLILEGEKNEKIKK